MPARPQIRETRTEMNRHIFILGLLILVSGCTVGPDYQRPEIDTAAEWRYQYSGSAEIINTQWWQQFEDPVLNELVTEALENNKDVRIAAARVEEFAARVDIARAGFYPQFGYQGSGSRNKLSDNTLASLPAGTPRISNNFEATLNAGWELDIWGKIRRASEAARANLMASQEVKRTVLLTLVTSVATSYVQLRALDRQLEISKETLESRKESLDLFELKFEGGVISELEVAQVRSEYEQAAASIPPIERQIALLENSLSTLLGRNPGPISRGKNIDELIQPAIPAEIPSSVLERRPDLVAAEQNLVAANAQIGIARAQYFPTISLTGLFGFASSELSDLAKTTSNFWNIGADATGPIFSGGRISAEVRTSEALQKQALYNYLQTIQTAFREVDDALIANQKSHEELAAQGRRVDALRQYAHYAEMRYNEGEVSYIEVLDAQRRLFDAELTYTWNQGDIYTTLINTYKAMGGGWILEAQKVADTADARRNAPPPDDAQAPDSPQE